MYRGLALFGIDPLKGVRSLLRLPAFFSDLKNLKKQQKTSDVEFPLGSLYPCLNDRSSDSGVAKGHYFHQDLLVARRVFAKNPRLHVDIGSRIDGFVAHVASFRAIEVLDIRSMEIDISNVRFVQADLMGGLSESLLNYCDSLSCLHSLEHFGLGRYGDPIHFDGYLLGLENMYKILQPGGTFYLSVPIGPQRIEFNAHRVFSLEYLLTLLRGRFKVEKFSYVDDKGALFYDENLSSDQVRCNFGCQYGCGILEMIKL